MASAGTVTVDFAAETAKFTAELKKVQGSLKGLEDRFNTLEKVGRLALKGFAGFSLVSFAKSAILAADALGDAAERAGIAVDEFTKLKFAADQSDVEFSAFTSGIQRFQIAISKAADGSKDAKTIFASLGVEIGKIRDLPISDQLGAVADAFVRIRDPADRTRLAVELFGKAAGPQLVPLLARGRDGIEELTATADRLGITMTDSAAKGIDRATKALGGFSTAVKSAFASRVGDLVTGIFGSGDQITDLEFKIKNLKILAEQLRLTNPNDVAQLKLINDQLAVLEPRLRAVAEAARGAFQMQLLPLPWVGLQEIDLKPIQDLKIPVDELNEAFLRLEETVARIREEQFTDALQIAADAAADRSKEIEAKISTDLEAELQRRSEAAQFWREDELRREEEAQAAIQALKRATYNNGLAALQAFAGHSKKIAIAAIVVQKAMALKEAFIAGQVALAKAAASAPPPYNAPAIFAAKVFMAANLAAIAATGIGQIQSINSSGGAPIGSPANPVFTNDSGSQQQFGATSQNAIQIIIANNVGFDQRVMDQIVAGIREAADDRDVILFGPQSRQAQEITGG